VQLVMPPHADVANAVGAVLGQVAQRVHLTVTQPVRGTYRVFGPNGPHDFANLDDALALARSQAAALALQRAHDAGASAPTVSFSQEDNAVTNDIDGHLFFEARITATASGAPVTKVV
jgi:hypothetical protein